MLPNITPGIHRTRDGRGGVPQKETRLTTGAELRRVMTVGKVDKDKRTVELAFSSDIELERWGEIEVLSHEKDACDLTRLNDGAALLFNHEWDSQLGIVESARIDPDGKGRAVVRFGNSALAEEKFRDVQDGILKHVSVGYRVKELKLTETRENGVSVYTVTRWEPYEISFVTVPADTSVGVGRNLNPQKKTVMNRAQIIAALKRQNIAFDESMSDEQLANLLVAGAPANAPTPPAPGAQRQAETHVDAVAEARKGSDNEFERVRQILELGKKHELGDLADEHVGKRSTVQEFKEVVMAKLAERAKALKASGELGMSQDEAKRFSFIRLFRSLADPSNLKLRSEAGYEFEVCQSAAGVSHRSAKGHIIPLDVLRQAIDPESRKRAGDVVSIKTGAGYTGTGAATVQTQLLASSFVELLRPRTFILRRASVIGGIVGNVDIPKQTTGTTGGWVGEDDSAPQSDVDFGLISLNPKTAAAFVDITRKMLNQSSLDIEALVRMDVAKGLGQLIDKAGIYGTGTAYQPKGLKYTDGINAVDFAAANPTFAELIALESEIAADNADVPSMAYVLNAKARGYAKSTLQFAGVAGAIWQPGDTINGYGTEVTNQVADGDWFFGNWSDLWAAFWGGLEITVDPYTHSTRGRIRITVMQDCDFALRRPESFTYGKNHA